MKKKLVIVATLLASLIIFNPSISNVVQNSSTIVTAFTQHGGS